MNAMTSASHESPTMNSSHSAEASVALDIGEDRGALIILPAARFDGREIEISPAPGDGHRVHTGVHRRRSAAGERLTAIFGSLPAGEYVIWEDRDHPATQVTVPAGRVAEISLP
jgi:hypothetical protein